VIVNLISLFIIVFAALLLFTFRLLQRKHAPRFRPIPAFQQLQRALNLSIEEGKQVHLSLGRGHPLMLQGAAGFASLGMLRHLAELTAAGDRPPLVTAGEGALILLAQDTMQSAYRAAMAEELYHPLTARLGGLSPMAYASSLLPAFGEKHTSAHVLMGNFGAEVLLLGEAAQRNHAFFVAASDNLSAQAALFTLAPHPLFGEELFAAGAYLSRDPAHQASLSVQDVLRWLLILALLVSPLFKFLGVF
jgi:hypothetical protein